eukprot:1514608-Amphidinium_carterae.1
MQGVGLDQALSVWMKQALLSFICWNMHASSSSSALLSRRPPHANPQMSTHFTVPANLHFCCTKLGY